MTITTRSVASPTRPISAGEHPQDQMALVTLRPSKSLPALGVLSGLSPRATREDLPAESTSQLPFVLLDQLPAELLSHVISYLPTYSTRELGRASKKLHASVALNLESGRLTGLAKRAPMVADLQAILNPETPDAPATEAYPFGRFNSIHNLPLLDQAESFAAVASRLVTLAKEIYKLPERQHAAEFVAIRETIKKLPLPLQGEPLLALGSHILALGEANQQAAIDGFLKDARSYSGPEIDTPDMTLEMANGDFIRGSALDMLILAATEGPDTLANWGKAREIAMASGPVMDAILAAALPKGSGERWDLIARRMHIVTPAVLLGIEDAVAHGPVTTAIIAALRPDGSGERWDHIAERMGITNQGLLDELEANVARGPVTRAVLLALKQGPSGARWNHIARDMGIRNQGLLDMLERTAQTSKWTLRRPGGLLERIGTGIKEYFFADIRR